MKLVWMFIYLYISYYTFSFGLQTWKEKNKLAAVMILGLSLTILATSAYVLFFKRSI